jgi:hypothetical protein
VSKGRRIKNKKKAGKRRSPDRAIYQRRKEWEGPDLLGAVFSGEILPIRFTCPLLGYLYPGSSVVASCSSFGAYWELCPSFSPSLRSIWWV